MLLLTTPFDMLVKMLNRPRYSYRRDSLCSLDMLSLAGRDDTDTEGVRQAVTMVTDDSSLNISDMSATGK